MSMSRNLLALLVVAAPWGFAGADEAPRLGEPLSADEVADHDFVVLPDGTGLPAGSGTARAGAAIYATHCLACHGQRGTGGINDVLAGGQGTIDGAEPVRTLGSYWPYATTVFDYIRRAMPYQEPGVLGDDEVYAVTAYLLYINGIIAIDDRMDADSLPAVSMPNSGNFVWAYTPRLRAGEQKPGRN